MLKFGEWSRSAVRGLLGVALVAILAACGGGGGSAGTPVVGPDPGASGPVAGIAAADLAVQLSKATLSTTGSDSVTVTVTSVDANRNALGKVPVTFAVDSNAVVTPAGTTTDERTGVLSATVQIGADTTRRTINLTVKSGDISRKASIDVVDSVTGGKVVDLSLSSNRSSIPNDGTAQASITVTTLDANRNAVGGSPVTLRVDNTTNSAEDAFISTGGATTTNATTGQLVGTLSLGANKANRAITILATSGTVTRAITVNVVTPVVTVPKAADITVLLDKLSIGNSGSEVVTATVTAVNEQRNTIPGIPVEIKVDNNATVQVASRQTDANGQVTAQIRIGADKSNRLVTVTVTSETLVRTATFQVTGTNILATASPASPDAGSTGNSIEYRVVDVNQTALVGVPITVTAAGVTTGNGVTNANGAYVFTYQAPATPGALDFTAVAAGKTLVHQGGGLQYAGRGGACSLSILDGVPCSGARQRWNGQVQPYGVARPVPRGQQRTGEERARPFRPER
jgi:hypothetical protein